MLDLAVASGVFVLTLLLLKFQVKLPAKGTPSAAHMLGPYYLHLITAGCYSLDRRLQFTSERSQPC